MKILLDVPEPSEEPTKGPGFLIRELFVFVAEDAEGAEGIISGSGVICGQVALLPFVTSDKARVDGLKERAVAVARMARKRVRLLRLSTREDLGVIWEP